MINSLKLKNLIKPFFSPKIERKESQYVMKQKLSELPIESLPNDSSWVVPEGATNYSLVVIGKKDNPGFERKVTTFYDGKLMLKRGIEGTGIGYKERVYDEKWKVENGWNGIFTRKRYITEKKFNEKSRQWDISQEEEQFTQTDMNDKNYVYPIGFMKKLHINKNVHMMDGDKKVIHSTVTEYPLNYSREPISKMKIIETDISMNKGIPSIDKVYENTNIELPKGDEFLPYRLLTGEQKQEALTRYYLDKKGLGDMNIGIRFSPREVAQNAEGYFDSVNGAVVYKKPSSGYHISVASHEGEHAYQYALNGRLGKLNTPYGIKCQKELPPVVDVEEMIEGFKYVIAAEKYPKLSPTEDLTKNNDYWYNDLETGARKAAKIMEEKYKKGRDYFLNKFPLTKNSNAF